MLQIKTFEFGELSKFHSFLSDGLIELAHHKTKQNKIELGRHLIKFLNRRAEYENR
jgi:hypothetical protein